jgi:hypothetical protein
MVDLSGRARADATSPESVVNIEAAEQSEMPKKRGMARRTV